MTTSPLINKQSTDFKNRAQARTIIASTKLSLAMSTFFTPFPAAPYEPWSVKASAAAKSFANLFALTQEMLWSVCRLLWGGALIVNALFVNPLTDLPKIFIGFIREATSMILNALTLLTAALAFPTRCVISLFANTKGSEDKYIETMITHSGFLGDDNWETRICNDLESAQATPA